NLAEDIFARTAGTELEVAAARPATRAAVPGKGVGARALETMKPFLAFSVDLAAIIGAAQFRIAKDFIGAADLRELCLRIRVVLIMVGMMPLGEFAVDGFDLLLGCILLDT